MESLVIKGFPLQGLIAHYNALRAPWVTFSADARNALWGHTIDHAEMVHPQISRAAPILPRRKYSTTYQIMYT